jgi:hypothetical protein
MATLKKFLELSRREQGLFLAALVLLPAAALRLRVFGVARDPRAAPAAPRRGQADDTRRVHETARMVAAAAHYGLYRASCLPRSIVLQWLLERQGIESDLRIGVRKDGEQLAAHAWVEFDGVPLIDSAAVHDRFAAFDTGEPRGGTASRPAR